MLPCYRHAIRASQLSPLLLLYSSPPSSRRAQIAVESPDRAGIDSQDRPGTVLHVAQAQRPTTQSLKTSLLLLIPIRYRRGHSAPHAPSQRRCGMTQYWTDERPFHIAFRDHPAGEPFSRISSGAQASTASSATRSPVCSGQRIRFWSRSPMRRYRRLGSRESRLRRLSNGFACILPVLLGHFPVLARPLMLRRGRRARVYSHLPPHSAARCSPV